MELVINKAKFYEAKEDTINVNSNRVEENIVMDEVFPEFDCEKVAHIKSLKKGLALNNVQVEDIGAYDELKKRKVLFPQQLRASTNRRMVRREERNNARAELLKEQRLSQEIMMQEYEEYRINEEIDEMFRLYRPEHKNENNNNQFEIVLDCTMMKADDINEILDQENA